MESRETCDILIIGAGFYGLYLGEYLSRHFPRVIVCERGPDALQRASYHNQARVHNGYHYPRSVLTAVRSRVNFPRFLAEFRPAIDADFQKVYAIARHGSKTSAEQYYQVMKRIGAPIDPASREISRLFDRALVEGVFQTTEYAFNSTVLKEIMLERVRRAKVDVRCQTEVVAVEPSPDGSLAVRLRGAAGETQVQAGQVFCCTYSQLNQPAAGVLRPIPLKHELTELALVAVPPELRNYGITMMDGPFFSCMSFPARQLHSLSHVRYTPHGHWYDGGPDYRPAYEIFDALPKETAYQHMVRDAARYVPLMKRCEYRGSLWEVKTLLPRSETDDSRPILFRPHYEGLRNYHLVMGGKIDTVYDVLDVMARQFGWTEL